MQLQLSRLILSCVLASFVGVSAALPIDGNALGNVIARTAEPPLLPLARRAMSGRQPRHLRSDYPSKVKRDGPDLGGIATFNGDPQPIRGPLGDTFLSASNHAIDEQNIDNLAVPPTDAGTCYTELEMEHVTLAHEALRCRLAKAFSAVEIRISANDDRELHWHRMAEWGYVLGGSGRITAVDEDGRTFAADIHGPTNTSDATIHYFPPGVPHSIQALDDGLELLLVFTYGDFDEVGTTFTVADWLARTPLEVVAKNLGVNVSVLAGIPQKDPVLFKSTVPPPADISQEIVTSPAGTVPMPFFFDLNTQNRTVAPGGGGWLKVQDSATNFPVATEFASVLINIEPSSMLELHWHPTDEWIYILSGQGRATAYAGATNARTFDFQEGDTAVFPMGYGHYMENISPTEPLTFLALFNAPRFVDFSATQLLALSPPPLVADMLNISTETVTSLPKEKQFIVA
ncbi:hypothetical protein NM688_g645 [Phlebia brevispora]|uniref:Uncharacterized protein n=1 Tax=Phlebia brevispora TaxID=194682 RepID=A0ACC1TDX1_9APHY|nr:hypothetical protein NM688_g645 [Phlebia brevispora]